MSSSLAQRLVDLYGREDMKKDPGLTRMRNALGEIIPELNQKKIITIAGTNGKGETTLWLSKGLGATPHCVWTSPHIERITERFRDERGEISEEELEKLVDESHLEVQSGGYKLSYYEFLFYVFCKWAQRKNPEVILLEVGLGGRLDAVNVFDSDLLLLPSISRDHQEFLGNRYELILKEKLALLRKGSLLISYLGTRYLREKANDEARDVGAQYLDLESFGLTKTWEFSKRNQILAQTALEILNSTPISEVGEVLKNYSFSTEFLEHRGEYLRGDHQWVLYGSHNVDGVRNLIQFLQSGNYTFPRPPFDAVLVSFSRRDIKDVRVMLRMLRRSNVGKIFVTNFPHPKAMAQETLEELAELEGISFVQGTEEYFREIKKGQCTLVAGSYYFLGHIKSRIRSIG